MGLKCYCDAALTILLGICIDAVSVLSMIKRWVFTAVARTRRLIDMGFEKLVNELDMKEASRAGLVTRPLTQKVVEKHLEDLGIEPEFGTHSHMRGLSGAPSRYS